MGPVSRLSRGGRWATGIAVGLLTLVLLLLPASGARAQPVRTGATVVAGPARFDVITPTLIRMEYAADGRFEDRPTFNAVARNVTPPRFALRRLRSGLEIRTGRLVLRYHEDSRPLGPTNVSVRVGRRVVRPAFGSPPRSDALGGWYRGLDFYPGQAGPVDQIELHQGLLTRQGWYLLDDSKTALRTEDGWVQPRPAHDGAYQDGYFFGYGADYKTALKDLTTLTGRAVLLPKWAFGNWFSKYFAYSFEDYKTQLLPAFRANRVPLDALVADTDWKAPNSWAGWNWNPALFPDPPGVPGLGQGGAPADDAQRPRGDLRGRPAVPRRRRRSPAASSRPRRRASRPSRTASTGPTATRPPRGSGCTTRSRRRACASGGWTTAATTARSSMPGLTPDSWVNELYRRDGDARGLRGFSLSRIGASFPDYNGTPPAGPWGEHRSHRALHRRHAARLGDAGVRGGVHAGRGQHRRALRQPRHRQLRRQAPARGPLPALGAARRVPAGEPRCTPTTATGCRGSTATRSSGPAASTSCACARRMVPYLYATARQAYDTGLPMARALYLDYPREPGAYTHDTEYLLGDQLLVAPVTTPGLTAQTTVWLPPGTWTDIFTGATLPRPGRPAGGQHARPDAGVRARRRHPAAGAVRRQRRRRCRTR